jgi:cell division initiation protein
MDSLPRGRESEVKVTPLDIRRKEFKRSMRGYSDEEVDIFLDDVADEFERLFQENIEFQDRIQRLEEQLAGHAQLKDALEKTLVSAQLQADQLIANARKEAELILRDAELKARDIVNDSYVETREVQQTLVQLKRLEEEFRFKFRSLLEGHLKLLNDAPIAPVSAVAAPGVGALGAAPAHVEPAESDSAGIRDEATSTAVPGAQLAETQPAETQPAETQPAEANAPVARETAVEVSEEAVAMQEPSEPLAGNMAAPVSPGEPPVQAPIASEFKPVQEPAQEEAVAHPVVSPPPAFDEGEAEEPTAEATVETVDDPTQDERNMPTQRFFFGRRLGDEDEDFFAAQPPAQDKTRDFEW